jgi:hypothetical protein
LDSYATSFKIEAIHVQFATLVEPLFVVVLILWFSYTYKLEGKIENPKRNKDIIAGIRDTSKKCYTKCLETTPRATKLVEGCSKLNQYIQF